jgi:dUTP pyrophosphatase
VQIRPRSGLAFKNGITVINSPGTIDSDYRGEIGVLLVNLSSESFEINNGDRIAQMVLSKYEIPNFIETSQISVSQRGKDGFGSTGKK